MEGRARASEGTVDRADAGGGMFLSGHMIKIPQARLVWGAGDHMGAVGHPGTVRGEAKDMSFACLQDGGGTEMTRRAER